MKKRRLSEQAVFVLLLIFFPFNFPHFLFAEISLLLYGRDGAGDLCVRANRRESRLDVGE
jgi:hypothetical protein